MKRSYLLSLLLLACAPKPTSTPSNPPTNPNLDRGSAMTPIQIAGTSVNLTCTRVGNSDCNPPSYTFAADYTQPANCQWTRQGELVFSMHGAAASDSAVIQVTNFNGPNTYQLGPNDYVRLSASVTLAATRCAPEHPGTEVAMSPKASCSGCTVTVKDPTPTAAFPKPLIVQISCPNTCNEDAYTCNGINMSMTQMCERQL